MTETRLQEIETILENSTPGEVVARLCMTEIIPELIEGVREAERELETICARL